MRALRDFNIPKIVTDDIPVFMGLIGDLFPLIDVPRKRSTEFEKVIKASAGELHLQAENTFVLKVKPQIFSVLLEKLRFSVLFNFPLNRRFVDLIKKNEQVVQLEELLDVRHSVFIVGDAGTGKSQIWNTLRMAYERQRRKPIVNDLNPKSLTNNELFGFINATTREWKDGLLSSLIRDQAHCMDDVPKWIILDGDIDPMFVQCKTFRFHAFRRILIGFFILSKTAACRWIESLNTVMDDNKVLTLASNERISLTKDMRLLFEVGHLRSATPATVSRGKFVIVVVVSAAERNE